MIVVQLLNQPDDTIGSVSPVANSSNSATMTKSKSLLQLNKLTNDNHLSPIDTTTTHSQRHRSNKQQQQKSAANLLDLNDNTKYHHEMRHKKRSDHNLNSILPPPMEFLDDSRTSNNKQKDNAPVATNSTTRDPMDTELVTRLIRTRQQTIGLSETPEFSLPLGTKKNKTKPNRTVLEQDLISPINNVQSLTTNQTNEKHNNIRHQQQETNNVLLVAAVAKSPTTNNYNSPTNNNNESPMRTNQPSGVCKFSTKIEFESDSDSVQQDWQQQNGNDNGSFSKDPNNNNGLNNDSLIGKDGADETTRKSYKMGKNKELITETKFKKINRFLFGSKSSLNKNKQQSTTSPVDSGKHEAPDWDYTLIVNRMNGDKIDSKVK